jgi:hypothetical protein
MPFGLDTKNARVYTEYSTDVRRRIDIVIDDGKMFIPIEVKIYAKDQENQISDYARFSLLKKNSNIPVLYLTIDGKDPDNANVNEYISISFKRDVLLWLNKCLRDNDTENIVPIREILKQLIVAIKSVCGKSEDEKMENAIEKLITDSEDKVKAAIEISKTLDGFWERPYNLFKDKVLTQLQKTISDAYWKDDKKYSYIIIPFKNGNYELGINYDWHHMEIWTDESKSSSKEINAIRKKMSELMRAEDEKWGEDYIWANLNIPYLGYPDIDENLFFYRLNKQYLENTSEVINTIVNIVKELENVK